MALDDSIRRVLADRTNSTCRTCRLIREGKVTDEQIRLVFEAHGAPLLAAALKLEYGEGPGPDAIRRHVRDHVAG